MKCIRCGQEIYLPHWNSNVCGSCADDLRAEEDAEMGAIQAQDKARQEQEAYQANKDAYEESERDRHFDDGNGYRYI